MRSRRALLAGVGTAALAGCLDFDDGTTSDPESERRRPDTESERGRPDTGTDSPETCGRLAKPTEPYDLAVVVSDAPSVPVDLTVTVERLGATQIATPTPKTAVPSPDEPDGGETPTAEPYDSQVFRERFVVDSRYDPLTRTGVFVGDDEFTVTADAGDSGLGWYWVRDATDGPTTVEFVVGADGVRVGETTDVWGQPVPCRG